MLRFTTSLQSDQERRLDQIFRGLIRVSIALAVVWVATLSLAEYFRAVLRRMFLTNLSAASLLLTDLLLIIRRYTQTNGV